MHRASLFSPWKAKVRRVAGRRDGWGGGRRADERAWGDSVQAADR